MLHLAHEQLLLLLSSLVAEGIKTVEVRDRLKELGCNIGQSFYYNERLPMPRFSSTLPGRAQSHD